MPVIIYYRFFVLLLGLLSLLLLLLSVGGLLSLLLLSFLTGGSVSWTPLLPCCLYYWQFLIACWTTEVGSQRRRV